MTTTKVKDLKGTPDWTVDRHGVSTFKTKRNEYSIIPSADGKSFHVDKMSNSRGAQTSLGIAKSMLIAKKMVAQHIKMYERSVDESAGAGLGFVPKKDKDGNEYFELNAGKSSYKIQMSTHGKYKATSNRKGFEAEQSKNLKTLMLSIYKKAMLESTKPASNFIYEHLKIMETK